VDLRRRDEDAAADHGDVDLAVSPWEPMELRRSPVGGQPLAASGQAWRQDSLLVGDPRAGNPVDTGVDPQPDSGVQPARTTDIERGCFEVWCFFVRCERKNAKPLGGQSCYSQVSSGAFPEEPLARCRNRGGSVV
jgi:hypothetical protein